MKRITCLTLIVGFVMAVLAGLHHTATAAPTVTLVVDPNSFFGCSDFFGNPYCTIHGALNDANSGDLILVAAGSYSGTHVIPPSLNGLVIRGNSYTSTVVSGLDSGRVFSITGVLDPNAPTRGGGGVYLENMTIRNGFSEGDGAGIFAKNAFVQLDDVRLDENVSEQRGGGLFADGSVIWLQHSIVERNSADFGGGLAIGATSTLQLGDSTLLNNSAIAGGGGIYNEGAIAGVSDLIFSGNSARFGGGVHQAGSGTLANSNFRFNAALDYGGAVFVQDSAELILYDSSTIRNKAEEAGDTIADGGALANFGMLTLLGVVTQGDSAENGGTLYNEGTAIITGSTLTSGSANVHGGGIYSTGSLTLTNSAIRFNRAEVRGGGLYNFEGDVWVSSSNFFANTSESIGGGMATAFGTTTIDNTRWYSNSAGAGGGLYANSTALHIDSSHAYDNLATDSGGGFYLFNGSVDIRNSSVYSNVALYSGGGLLLRVQGVLDNLDIYNNDGGLFGGGITSLQAPAVRNTRIFSNTAQRGGGLFNEGSTAIQGSRIWGNSADYGAGIYSRRAACSGCASGLTLSQSTVDHNRATQRGGAIGVDSGGVTVTNSTVASNVASLSGGIWQEAAVGEVVSLTLHHATIANNDGVGLSLLGSSAALSVRHTIIANNGTDCAGLPMSFTNDAPNLDGDGSCTSFMLSGDPLLGPLQNNGGMYPTQLPAQGSPAVDVGNLLHCLAVDQVGNSRLNKDGNGNGLDGNWCDLGAMERQTSLPTAVRLVGVGLRVSAEIPFIHTLFSILLIATITLAHRQIASNTCTYCGGTGELTCHVCDGRGSYLNRYGRVVRCDACHGKRTVTCRHC